MVKRICLPILLSVILILSGCMVQIYPSRVVDNFSDSSNDLNGTLTLNGSTSMTKLCNALGEAFMEKYPGVLVSKSDTGSGAAVASVLEGTALIGDISRNLKSNEGRERFNEVTIALDGIAVIVNKSNPISNLGYDQVTKIFKKEITNWSEIGGEDRKITLIGREESSGTREGFEAVLGIRGNLCKYDAEYPESGDIVAKVGNDVSAIGYVSITATSDNIKLLKINQVEPTERNIISGAYRLQRPFIEIFLQNSDNKLIKAWFDFIGSDSGKEIIRKEKFVAVDIKIDGYDFPDES